jgi:hypothetical protein
VSDVLDRRGEEGEGRKGRVKSCPQPNSVDRDAKQERYKMTSFPALHNAVSPAIIKSNPKDLKSLADASPAFEPSPASTAPLPPSV